MEDDRPMQGLTLRGQGLGLTLRGQGQGLGLTIQGLGLTRDKGRD